MILLGASTSLPGIIISSDTVTVALGDLAYSAAPIYGDVSPEVPLLTGIAVLMNRVLMMILVRRETET